MIINYCPSCEGHPYTTDTSISVCPRCGAQLETEFVFESDLTGRPTLSPSWRLPSQGTRANSEDNAHSWFDDPTDDFFNTSMQDGVWDDEPTASVPDVDWQSSSPLPTFSSTDSPAATSTGHFAPVVQVSSAEPVDEPAPGTTIRGKVSNYSNSETEAGQYRRFFFQRLVDAVVYGQRFEDLVHRFTVRVRPDGASSGAYVDVPVNVHGTISGGMQIMDNAEVEVTGRYKNGVLMARRIAVINGNSRTYIQFQRAVGAMLVFVVVAALVAFLVMGGFDLIAGMAGGVGSFLMTWLCASIFVMVIMSMILSHLGTPMQFMLLRGNFPLLVVLGIGLLIALAMTNAFGLGGVAVSLGDSLLSMLSTLAGPIITLVVIFYLLRLMLP